MTLETLIEKLQELSREWHDKYDKDASLEPHFIGVGFDQAADDLDDLISQAQQPPTDTTP